MKILIACDKFKGSLTALEACQAVAAGLPGHDGETCPIADGGEGFVDALLAVAGGKKISAPCCDALGREVVADYAVLDDGSAVIEMSAASGLWRISEGERDPLRSTTLGTGQLIRHAIEEAGAKRLLVGIGGSATNDGGVGMAEALGVIFQNSEGKKIHPTPDCFDEIEKIDESEMIKVPPMTVACDVTNPLLGPAGATAVFGPQKGVLESAFSRLEGALKHLAGVMECDPEFPGAGAAGGLGYGLRYFCDAEMVSGFDLVAEALCLKERIKEVDLVITGEGSLDEQTLDGKGPAGVALMARKMGKRVIGVAGQVADEARPLFDEAYALSELQLPLEELMANAAFLLEHLVKDKVVL